MDFALDETQVELGDLARRILTDQVTHEHLKALEARPAEDRFDRGLWATLAEANLLGVAIPEDHGGMGFGLVELGVVFHAIGTALPYVPAIGTLCTAALLAEQGTASQQALLDAVSVGGATFALAATETALYDLNAPGTAAAADGDDWVLTGEKVCVPYAGSVDKLVVTTTSAGGGAVFLVDPGAAGVTITPVSVTNREPQATVTLDGVRVGTDALVGLADGEALARLVDITTAMTCATLYGIAEKAMTIAADYGKERHQFDVPIGSFQAFHQRIADSYIEVLGIRLSTWQAIWRLAEGLPATDEVAMAKAWASEHAYNVTFAAIHLHGGMGVDVDYPLHRYYLWARDLELRGGSAAVHYDALGKRLAGSATGPGSDAL